MISISPDILRGKNIVLIGPPGSGKSTFVEGLQKESKSLNYISAGDITRKILAEDASQANEIKALYATNEPWPDDFVVKLVLPYLLESKSGYILDGVPRKRSEVVPLLGALEENKVLPNLLLDIFTSREKSIERIQSRIEAGDIRPEKMSHYLTRLDMYWENVAAIKAEFALYCEIINLDSTEKFTPALIHLLYQLI